MRDDHSGAAVALRRIAKAISSTDPEDKRRIRAYLVWVGRMFRDNEIVRAALVELRRRESNDDERFAKREQALLGPATAALQRLALALAPDGPLQEETLQAIQRETTATGRMRPPVALADMLREARAGQLPALTLDDLSPLGQAAERLLRCLSAYSERDLEASFVVDHLTAIRTACASVNNAIETRRFLDYLSIGRTMDRLIDVAHAWDAALRDDSIADPPHYQDGLAQHALVVIDRICDELDFRTVRRFALYRLRVFFEHFEHHRLRTELAEAEAERRRREDILQRVMDRFLFQEGYFPLTSVAASRGNIDTAIVGPMEEAGIPPILVELKQVTAFQVPSQANRRAVTDAIDVGRGEVQRYRASLASRPQWGGIIPFVVVVHTCDEDISDLECDDVILIDLSATTPSRKRGRRL
jgi:hypothetical protein